MCKLSMKLVRKMCKPNMKTDEFQNGFNYFNLYQPNINFKFLQNGNIQIYSRSLEHSRRA